MRITNPKLVKKANQWTITLITKTDKGKDKYEQLWFDTESEAEAFKQEKETLDTNLDAKNRKATL